MNKKKYDLLLKALSKLGEVKVSKKGNYYVELSRNTDIVTTDYNYFNVTKAKINNVGETFTYPKISTEIIMLTTTGVYYKNTNSTKFSKLSLKDVRHKVKLKELFLIGKRAEWLKNYPQLSLNCWNYIKSFSSLREMLKHLGVTFNLSNITENQLECLIVGYKFQDKHDILKYSPQYILDIIRMINQTGLFEYYQTSKSLPKVHNELVEIINKNKLESYSNTPIFPVYAKQVIKQLEDSNIKFTWLNNHRDLVLEGMKQHHCVSSRQNQLYNTLFFNIEHAGKDYTLQCTKNTVVEFKGKYNEAVPVELKNIIIETLNPKYENIFIASTNNELEEADFF